MKEELSKWVEQERGFRSFYYKKGQLRLYIADNSFGNMHLELKGKILNLELLSANMFKNMTEVLIYVDKYIHDQCLTKWVKEAKKYPTFKEVKVPGFINIYYPKGKDLAMLPVARKVLHRDGTISLSSFRNRSAEPIVVGLDPNKSRQRLDSMFEGYVVTTQEEIKEIYQEYLKRTKQ